MAEACPWVLNLGFLEMAKWTIFVSNKLRAIWPLSINLNILGLTNAVQL